LFTHNTNTSSMKFVALIPARGGSKRLPRKNILYLAGEPLIAHSIKYATQNNITVYVSTDNQEIKEMAKKYGANVIDRPAELASDHATTASVLKHTAEYLIDKGIDFDYIITLQATNPLRPEWMLKQTIDIIEKEHPDSLFAVNPILRKQGRIINNQFKPVNYHFGQRSQDMETWYYENGLLYISSKETCLAEKVITDNAYPFVVDHIFGEIDIDTLDDFRKAEYFMLQNHE